jgi:hypothetical protein
MGPKIVRARDSITLNAKSAAGAGAVYLLVGVAAQWRWDWESWLTTVFFVIIGIPVEWWRFSGRKPLPPSDAVVADGPPVVRDALLWGVIGASLLLLGAMSDRFAVGLGVAMVLWAGALGLNARRLQIREETTGSIVFVPTRFLWPWGIWESRGVGWYPDPSGRHEWRLWDGSWRSSVADDGVLSEDHPEHLPATPWT